MALADFYNKVNVSGMDLYSAKRGRIVREGEKHSLLSEKRETDKNLQEIAHLSLRKENIAGQILQLRKDIIRAKEAGYTPSLVAEKERILHKLQNDSLRLQGDIYKIHGRTGSVSSNLSHNLRYF